MKDLTISNIERQNVLNNRFAVSKVQEHLDIEGMLFEGEYRFTKKMVADFYEVEERTIERYLEKHSDELAANGYVLCKGKHLKELKLQFAPVINVGSKTTQLGLFNFRSFLDMGMLLTESEKAKKVRSLILDFVITTINEKTGGGTKYINAGMCIIFLLQSQKKTIARISLLPSINMWTDIPHTNILKLQTLYIRLYSRRMLRSIGKY